MYGNNELRLAYRNKEARKRELPDLTTTTHRLKDT